MTPFILADHLNLGCLILNPYENTARAAFYRQLQNANRYTVYE